MTIEQDLYTSDTKQEHMAVRDGGLGGQVYWIHKLSCTRQGALAGSWTGR